MGDYIKITFQDPGKENKEILIAQLSAINCHGLDETNEDLVAYIQQSLLDEVELKSIADKLNVQFKLETIVGRNWNSVWESNYTPVNIDDYCRVRASFHEPSNNFKHDILITPKMSFGTGHHATTFMMIRKMRTLNTKDKYVLDLGTGTGILSILSEKEGAKKVTAIDNDKWSVENANENIQLNNCSRIKIIYSDKVPNEQFDIILANINKNVILDNAKQMIRALREDGTVVISGLLIEDEPDITSIFRELSFEVLNKEVLSGWICLSLGHKQNN